MANKDERIYIRINEKNKSDFEKAANYRGLKPSTFLHQLAINAINELKEIKPHIFDDEMSSKIKSQEVDEMTIEQPGYEGKFDNKDKEKAS